MIIFQKQSKNLMPRKKRKKLVTNKFNKIPTVTRKDIETTLIFLNVV